MQILFFLNEVYMPLEVKSRHWSFSGAATLAVWLSGHLAVGQDIVDVVHKLPHAMQLARAGILLVILPLGETGTQL